MTTRNKVFTALSAVAVFISVFLSRWRGFPFDYKPPIDLEVYIQGGLLMLRGQPLYEQGVPTSAITLPFTYPPFSALLFATFAWLPQNAIFIGFYLATICFALLIGHWLRLPLWVMPLILLCTQPGFATLSFGQINIFLMTLILADALDKRPRWLPRGFLIGIAAAIKVTPAIFILWYLVRRDIRGFLGVIAGGAVATGLAALIRPHDTWTYFTDALPNANRVGDPAYIHNGSLTGMLTRLGLESFASVASICAVALGCWAAYRAAQAGHDLLALCAVAATGLLFSPISWTHHFVWLPVIAVAATQAGMHRAYAWWIAIATTVGMTLTSFTGWIAAFGAAQYTLILLVLLVWLAWPDRSARSARSTWSETAAS